MGCEVVTVSADTQYVHRAWKQAEKDLAVVRYQMGADRTGRIARLFGVYDEARGNALRATFIINPDGILLTSEVNLYNLGRNIDELVRKFKANLYMSRKPDEACPSKWRDEGDQTLVSTGARRAGTGQDAPAR